MWCSAAWPMALYSKSEYSQGELRCYIKIVRVAPHVPRGVRWMKSTRTHRHTGIQTHRHTHTHTGIQAYRHTGIQAYRHTGIQVYRQTDRHTRAYHELPPICAKCAGSMLLARAVPGLLRRALALGPDTRGTAPPRKTCPQQHLLRVDFLRVVHRPRLTYPGVPWCTT